MNHEGIGLGLTIVKQIVELCGGHVDVVSKGEDQGSTFRFSMKMGAPDKQGGRVIVSDSSDKSDDIQEESSRPRG